ncbi:MAG: ABC transporter ATP-binding protein [Planctomycetota bacterium]|jgi:ABC-2 type transport system ATP-binding protein
MSDLAVRARGLTRYYGSKCAVDSLDLRAPKGIVYGLIGRNGSGKTTIIKMLVGLLRPTRGSSTVLGRDSQEIDPATRARIGYLPEGHPLYGWMRVGAAGRFVASFYETWNAGAFSRLLEYFELDPRARVKQLSRGQRAQVALSLVLAQEPELLIMDDPTLGLDAVVRREFVESIVELIQAGGRTVLFSSHQLGDVERVADRIAVLDRGVLRADCTVDTFRAKVKRVHLTFASRPPGSFDLPGIVRRADGEREVALTIANFDESVVEGLKEAGAESVEVADLGLEDAFVDYTSGGERTAMLASVLGTANDRRGPAK